MYNRRRQLARYVKRDQSSILPSSPWLGFSRSRQRPWEIPQSWAYSGEQILSSHSPSFQIGNPVRSSVCCFSLFVWV